MKKILLFALLFVFGIQLNAQQRIKKFKNTNVTILENDKPVPIIKESVGETNFPLNPVNDDTRAFNQSNKIAGTSIGVTTYDLQSNAAIAPRIVNSTNGTSAIWTISLTNSLAAPDRGTGYNFDGGAGWGASPSVRIETARTGWPSIGVTANGIEHVMSHEFSLFANKHNTRPTVGTGAWTQTDLPLTDGTLFNNWLRLATGGSDGNSLHVIDILASVALGGSIYQGMDAPITYSRSEDAGATWNIDHVILPGFDSTLYANGGRADSYSIDASGTTVAIVKGGITEDWALWKSTDNGTTFTKIVINTFPFANYDDATSITDVNNDGIADTILTSDGYVAVLIDNNGMIHSWSGPMLILDDVIADPLSLFLSTDGLLYWNESMGTDSSQVIAFAPDRDLDGMLSFAYDYVPRYGNGGQTTQPQAGIDANGNIVLSFVTIMENTSSGNPTPLDFSFRNNFLMASNDGGATWLPPYNVGNSDFDECVYPSITRDIVGGCVDVIWQQDGQPGIAVQPPITGDQSSHPFGNNDIIHECVDINLLLTSVNELESSGLQLDLYPNPVSNVLHVTMQLEKDAAISFEIVNVLGSTTAEIPIKSYYTGTNNIKLDVSELNSGLYFLTAKLGEGSQSLKFIVE